MATLIDIETGRTGYEKVLSRVVDYGRPRAPRGLATRDLGHTTVHVESPYDALPLGLGRNLSTQVAAIEALQLIAGEMHEDLLIKAAPKFEEFTEPDGTFHGAYGVRAGDQLEQVAAKLEKDPDTRQAVMTLWDPKLDNLANKRDYPCTVALGFTVDHNDFHDRLDLHVLMRSNDVFLGFPYDVFNFTQLQLTLAGVLGLEPGSYTHTAWSLHIYERDIDRAFAMKMSKMKRTVPDFTPEGVGSDGDALQQVQDIASCLLSGHSASHGGRTASEEWYHEQLAPLVG